MGMGANNVLEKKISISLILNETNANFLEGINIQFGGGGVAGSYEIFSQDPQGN